MAEPSTSVASVVGLTGLAVGLLGPTAGPYAVIVACAVCGTLWPLLCVKTDGQKDGAWLVLRCTFTAVALTSVIAALAERMLGIKAIDLVGPVAFVIGAIGNGWRALFDALAKTAGALVEKRGGA